MRSGRPPGISLDPAQDGSPAVQAAGVDVDGSGRIKIPMQIGQRIGWLNVDAKQDVLVVMPRPGVVELCSWLPHGAAVVAKRTELEARLKAEPDVRAALIQLTLRYRRMVVGKEFRCSLPIDVRLHLGMRQPGSGRLHVLQVSDRIELLSREAMDEVMGEEHDDLAGMP